MRRIAAFAIMHFGDEVAHLNLLAVAPEHRRQGLGRQLMDWLTATAIEAGVFRINLEVRSQTTMRRASSTKPWDSTRWTSCRATIRAARRHCACRGAWRKILSES